MDDELEIRADVCIVGAGIAGLNALWVASQYLGGDQVAVLVDCACAGGYDIGPAQPGCHHGRSPDQGVP